MSKDKKAKKPPTAMGIMCQRLLFLTAFLFGLSLLLYPFVSQAINDYLDQKIVQSYQKKANEKNDKEIKKAQEKMKKRDQQVKKENNPGSDGEPFSEVIRNREKKEKITPSYVEEHTIGTVIIPEIDVRLPVFDKTSEYFLSKGASLLEGTSSLLGGKSTHAVISSHRGLKDAKLFTSLPKLKESSRFYIEVNGETHAYEVDQTKVIEPTNVNDLLIVEGKDYVTLMTCTPYSINSHRLLVRGHRIPFTKEMKKEIAKVAKKKKVKYVGWIVLLSLLVLLLLVVVFRIIRIALMAKRKYKLSFYLRDQKSKKRLKKVTVQLMNKSGKAPIKLKGRKVYATSNQKGFVKFPTLEGKNYSLKIKGEEHPIFAKVMVKKLKHDNFSYRRIKDKSQVKENKIFIFGVKSNGKKK